jgi:hypothetical protein
MKRKKQRRVVVVKQERVTSQRQQQQQRRLLFEETACDILSQVLVRWPFPRLLHFSLVALAVVSHTDPLSFDAAREARDLEVECPHQGAVLFTRFYSDVVRNAQSPPLPTPEQEAPRRQYYCELLRACFLVAAVKHPAVRAFVMAHHSVLSRLNMHCAPLPRRTAEAFFARATTSVDAFVARQLSLRLVCEQCVAMWRDEFMLRTYNAFAVEEDGGDGHVQVAFFGGGRIDCDEEVVDGALQTELT